MAFNYGGNVSYKNTLYFLSSDAVLDIDNQNTGVDLLRRIFGSFYYYNTDSDNHNIISMDGYETEKITNLVDTEIFRVTVPNCEQIQYVEVNPARIQVINENVDIPNLKVPIRLYADKDNKNEET